MGVLWIRRGAEEGKDIWWLRLHCARDAALGTQGVSLSKHGRKKHLSSGREARLFADHWLASAMQQCSGGDEDSANNKNIWSGVHPEALRDLPLGRQGTAAGCTEHSHGNTG